MLSKYLIYDRYYLINWSFIIIINFVFEIFELGVVKLWFISDRVIFLLNVN